MENMDSEKEQLQQIKRWIQENGMSLVLGVVLGLGGVYGWRGWQSHQVTVAENISVEIHVIEQLLSSGQYEQAAVQAEKLVKDNQGSLYADMSRLLLARARVEQGQMDKAVEPLKEIVADKQSTFNAIATLRLARLYLAQSKLDEVEQLLSVSVDSSYAYAFEELRGDLEYERGQYAAARTAYMNSMTLASQDTDTQFIQMKIDDLPAAE